MFKKLLLVICVALKLERTSYRFTEFDQATKCLVFFEIIIYAYWNENGII